MKLQLKNRDNEALIHEGEYESIKEMVNHCSENKISMFRANLGLADLGLADLRLADLRCADLGRADLYGADLRGTKAIASIYSPGMTSYGGYIYAVDHTTQIMLQGGCKWLSEPDMIAHVNKIKSGNALAQCLMAIDTLCRGLELAREKVTK